MMFKIESWQRSALQQECQQLLSNEERVYIMDHYKTETDDELATRFNKPVDIIVKYRSVLNLRRKGEKLVRLKRRRKLESSKKLMPPKPTLFDSDNITDNTSLVEAYLRVQGGRDHFGKATSAFAEKIRSHPTNLVDHFKEFGDFSRLTPPLNAKLLTKILTMGVRAVIDEKDHVGRTPHARIDEGSIARHASRQGKTPNRPDE